MTFAAPAALFGLLGLPVVLWLHRRRRRPVPRRWPSLALWRAALAERDDPAPATARRARRPRDLRLWLELAAVALLSVAAAGPVAGARARPLVLVVEDVSPRMHARRADGATALDATRAEVARLTDALRKRAPAPEIRTVATADDPAVVAAASDADLRVLATNRRTAGPVGPGVLVVGRAAAGRNLSLSAVRVHGDELWFAATTEGDDATLRVRVGADERTVPANAGATVPFRPARDGGVVLEILDDDNYDGDDRVVVRPFALPVRDETGSPLVAAALRAGVPARAAPDGWVFTTEGGEPRDGVVRGRDVLVPSPLFEGLLLDECAWSGVRVRPGRGLLELGDAALATFDGRVFWLGLPVDRPWDAHGTLGLLIERVKREAASRSLPPGAALVGHAVAAPRPARVETAGVDRPWDGTLPPLATPARTSGLPLRPFAGWLAAAALAAYLGMLSFAGNAKARRREGAKLGN